jgi:DNA-binding LacI/PurR family transcriptional regulator
LLVQDIAVSAATVDRVFNARAGVRPHMTRRVKQAVQELERTLLV